MPVVGSVLVRSHVRLYKNAPSRTPVMPMTNWRSCRCRRSHVGCPAHRVPPLASTEAQFHKTVLTRLNSLGAQVRSLAQHDRDPLREAVRASMVTMRFLPWRADRSPPGALLRADIDDPVPFHGRDEDLVDALA